jgi:hypothetical protein
MRFTHVTLLTVYLPAPESPVQDDVDSGPHGFLRGCAIRGVLHHQETLAIGVYVP